MAIEGTGFRYLRRLTFEVSWRQRQATKPKPQKMYTVPVARAWWPAVGAQLDRGVGRRHLSVNELPMMEVSNRRNLASLVGRPGNSL
jgi:hypothetical protein